MELDEKDRAILRTLAQQANLPLVEIARCSKLSVEVVKYRLRQLNQKVIQSHRLVVDFNRIGYYHYVLLLKSRMATPEEEQKLLSWCTAKRSVIYCSKRIGLYDFEINVAIKDLDELNAFLAELKSGFGSMIDSHELVMNTRVIKLNYVPF